MTYTYKHPRPSVTVDTVLFAIIKDDLKILLIKRKQDPFKDHWALPGGFLEIEEAPVDGVRRELKEETGFQIKEVEQIGAFGEVGRDPRGRMISIAYGSIIFLDKIPDLEASSDAKEVKFYSLNDLPSLAFDHDIIIQKAIERLLQLSQYCLSEDKPVFNLSTDQIKKFLNLLK